MNALVHPHQEESPHGLCVEAGVNGNLVPDADLDAMAIEAGREWASTDRDTGRFADLRWRHLLR